MRPQTAPHPLHALLRSAGPCPRALWVPPAAGPSAEHAKEGDERRGGQRGHPGAGGILRTRRFQTPTKPIGNFYTRKEVEETPEYFHSTSMYPRVLQDRRQVGSGRGEPHGLQRGHLRRRPSGGGGEPQPKEGRQGHPGRSEKCEEGIYMHCNGFYG